MAKMFTYYYDDTPKTNMNAIKDNKNGNQDFDQIKKLCGEKKVNNREFELDNTLKFLKIDKIYLGFNSAYEIYNKHKKQFKKKGLEPRDASHPCLFFDFGQGCSYYVDYMPDKGSSKTAKFLYGNKYGLRYCQKTFEEFIAHNDTLCITLKARNNITFYDYFIKVCENDSWTKDAHNYEKHNCNHFILKSMKLLNVELFEKDNFENNFRFTKEINSSKRDAIKDNIPYIFHQILQINY